MVSDDPLMMLTDMTYKMKTYNNGRLPPLQASLWCKWIHTRSHVRFIKNKKWNSQMYRIKTQFASRIVMWLGQTIVQGCRYIAIILSDKFYFSENSRFFWVGMCRWENENWPIHFQNFDPYIFPKIINLSLICIIQ